jgi:hypothetical protein
MNFQILLLLNNFVTLALGTLVLLVYDLTYNSMASEIQNYLK